ncbi:MAG TPA: hypothetical protein VFH08_07600 [Chitinophagaceae bacterium]|nr:hypothetical protein [Chitinophagaceae bacterium]
MHRALIFITFLKEKLLATKPRLAIFAIPKNDVVRTNFKGWIGSSPDSYRDGKNADSNKWIGSSPDSYRDG